MKTKNFFAELRRRKVYRVAVAYAIVSWLLIQIAHFVARCQLRPGRLVNIERGALDPPLD